MNDIDVIRQETQGMTTWAAGLVVATAEDYKMAVEKIGRIKELRASWVSYWKDAKEKAHGAWKKIVSMEKEGTDVCDQAEAAAKNKALTWKMDQDRKAQAEQRRLQAEADERARRERERLEKEAAKLKTPEKIEERLAEAAAVQAPVVTVEVPVVEIKGASTRTVWKAEVSDMAALIAAATPGSVAASFLMVNQSAADAFARSTKGAVAVPGVKFNETKGLSIGRGV